MDDNQRGSPPQAVTPIFSKRFLTQEPPDRAPVRLSFSPSGILQSFGFPLPFRRRNKSRESPRRASQLNSPLGLTPQTLRPRELIELANFGIVELDPLERGVGHDFVPAQLKNPTWCDRCGDLIWGLYKTKHYLRCKNCQFTCHQDCQALVSLDCQGIAETRSIEFQEPEEVEFVKPKIRSTPQFLEYFGEEELKQRLQKYNDSSQGLSVTLEDDGQTFRGFIRVHLNLTRPINVVAGTRPPSIYDILKEEEDNGRKTLTSFYLPRDTVKALHITSDNTTREVIAALLRKFKVIDNPHKFALYERYKDNETNQTSHRRIQDHEKPLILALIWCDLDKQFVLQENETEDIMWDEFAMPELQNFIKILEREEEEYINQVKRKFFLMREKMNQALAIQQLSKPINGLTKH